MDLSHAVQVQAALGDGDYEEVDVIVHSPGGSIHAAYQIVEMLRLRSDVFFACVPLYAKSAATLICIAADAVHMDELAQLGPLDTQILEERKGGKTEYSSALNPFKALEQLQEFGLQTLDYSVRMLLQQSGLDVDECLGHSIEFVKATTGPLFSRLDPKELGTYSRALAVGEEYAKRLLNRYSERTEEEVAEVANKLVHGYPSHDYIIDYHELVELGFDAKLFDDKEQTVARQLVRALSAAPDDVILLVDPDEGGITEADEITEVPGDTPDLLEGTDGEKADAGTP